MSVTPTKPKQRTQFLVKDILFQEKYKLSSTEVDLMSYIFNSMTWAFKVEGYLTITSKKFTDDLPHIGMKTVEASLRTLKQMELVEVEMIYHPIWKSNVRGIRITSRGMEYGMKLYKPSEQKIKERYESEIASYQTQLTETNNQLRILQKHVESISHSCLDNPKEETKPQVEGFKKSVCQVENPYIPNVSFVEDSYLPPDFDIDSYRFQMDDEYIEAESQYQAQKRAEEDIIYQAEQDPVYRALIRAEYDTMYQAPVKEERRCDKEIPSPEEIDEIYQDMAETKRAEDLSTLMEDYAREDALKEQREEEAYERAKSISEAIVPVQEPKVEEETPKTESLETAWTPKNQEEPITQTPEVEQETKVKAEVEAEKTETERVIEKPTPKEPKERILEKDFEMFIAGIKRYYGHTSAPICNRVGNGWAKETTFYINSYNRLSIITPANEHKQLKDPILIYSFWQWLYTHSSRIGDKIDFDKKPTIKELEKRFLNQTILIGDKKERVCEFVEATDGVKIKVANQEGKVRFIMDKDTHKEKVFELGMCQKVLFDRLH